MPNRRIGSLVYDDVPFSIDVNPVMDTFGFITSHRIGRALTDGYQLLDQCEDREDGDEGLPPEGCDGFHDPFDEPSDNESDDTYDA